LYEIARFYAKNKSLNEFNKKTQIVQNFIKKFFYCYLCAFARKYENRKFMKHFLKHSATKYILLFAMLACSTSCQIQRSSRHVQQSFNLMRANSQQIRVHNFTDTIDVRFHNGYIVVPVEIAGKTRQFILDTGAPFTFIFHSLAEELNYQGKKRFMHVSFPLCDNKNEMKRHPVSRIKEFSIGNIKFENIWVAENTKKRDSLMNLRVPCFNLYDGLLGSDLLGALSIKFDMKNSRIILSDNSLFSAENPEFRQPMGRSRSGLPYIYVSVQDERYHALFDTGFPNWGFIGKRKQYRNEQLQCLNELVIGGISMKNMPINFSETRNFSLIGTTILRHTIVVLDYKNNKLELIPYNNTRQIEFPANFGFGFTTLPTENYKAVITELRENSPAERAGLQVDYQIKEVNGIFINDESLCGMYGTFDLRELLAKAPTVKLLVVDLDGNEKEVVLTRE